MRRSVAILCYIGILALLVLIPTSVPHLIALTKREVVTDTIVKSERVSGGESGKYLIFGEREVYENTDVFVIGKFNSSDFYRDLRPGKTYRFTVIGRRIPFLSAYRNIIAFEEVK